MKRSSISPRLVVSLLSWWRRWIGPEHGTNTADDEGAEQRIMEAAGELAEDYSSKRDLVAAVAEKTQLPRRQVYQVLHRDA